jgi:hypothetical protein
MVDSRRRSPGSPHCGWPVIQGHFLLDNSIGKTRPGIRPNQGNRDLEQMPRAAASHKDRSSGLTKKRRPSPRSSQALRKRRIMPPGILSPIGLSVKSVAAIQTRDSTHRASAKAQSCAVRLRPSPTLIIQGNPPFTAAPARLKLCNQKKPPGIGNDARLPVCRSFGRRTVYLRTDAIPVICRAQTVSDEQWLVDGAV